MPRLTLQNIAKYYGATAALTSGNLSLESGEIHVLIGANGSGKSTLCKVIAGSVRPDEGQFELQGQQVTLKDPQDARDRNICLFYQELSLSQHLSVAQNICLFDLPVQRGGLIDEDALQAKAECYIEKFAAVAGDDLTAQTIVNRLRPDQKQLVEIMKTLASEADILIFDEPTSALDRAQVECFFDVLRDLKAAGRSIIFISHRMDEIFEIGDRISVIRDGETISCRSIAKTSHEEVIRDMIGEQPSAAPASVNGAHMVSDAPCLVAKDLTGPRLKNVSITLAEGEILGLGGLHGQGQSQLLRSLFGAEKLTAGHLTLDGQQLKNTNPRAAIRNAFAYVSGDRVRDGVISGRSIMENCAPIHILRDRKWLTFPKALRAIITPALASLSTKYESLGHSIASLSGGNQQKVVIARWLTNTPKILLLDDPTKGIDLGAKNELFALVRQLADQGMAIILYSSEDAELLAHSDRILVFNNGAISKELTGEQKTRFNLYQAAYEGNR